MFLSTSLMDKIILLIKIDNYLCTPKMSTKDINIIVGQKVKEYRTFLGLSQAEFANKVDINRATLSQLEAGKQQFTLSLIYKLAQKLNVEITDFLPLVKHLEMESSSDSDLITEKLQQHDVTESTKNSILQLLNKKTEDDK